MALSESSGHNGGSGQGAGGMGTVGGLSTSRLRRASVGKSCADAAAVEARKRWRGELVRLETAATGALASDGYGVGGGIGQGNGTARAIK